MIGSLIYIRISYQLAALTLHFRLSYPMNINLQESNTLAWFSGVSYIRLLLFQPLTVFNWQSLGKYVSSSNENIIHHCLMLTSMLYTLALSAFHSSNHLTIPTYSFFKASFQSQVQNEALIHLSSHVLWHNISDLVLLITYLLFRLSPLGIKHIEGGNILSVFFVASENNSNNINR